MCDWFWLKGVLVMGLIDYGFCMLIYFVGFENLVFEFLYFEEFIDVWVWIDLEVVELVGISVEEFEKYKNLEVFED